MKKLLSATLAVPTEYCGEALGFGEREREKKRKGELLQPGNHRGIKLPSWSEINYRQGSKNRFAHPF